MLAVKPLRKPRACPCGSILLQADQFCGMCGAEAPPVCKCGNPFDHTDKYCTVCGLAGPALRGSSGGWKPGGSNQSGGSSDNSATG